MTSKPTLHIGVDLGRHSGLVAWREGDRHPLACLALHMIDSEPTIYEDFFSRFTNWLKFLELRYGDIFDNIVVSYEYVAFMKSRAATNIWSGLRGIMLLVTDQNSRIVQVNPVHVGTLKKFATDSGKATKPQMRKAMERVCPDFPQCDNDNVVDAGWLARYGVVNSGETK